MNLLGKGDLSLDVCRDDAKHHPCVSWLHAAPKPEGSAGRPRRGYAVQLYSVNLLFLSEFSLCAVERSGTVQSFLKGVGENKREARHTPLAGSFFCRKFLTSHTVKRRLDKG